MADISDLSNNPDGDKWGNPLSRGILVDNTATKGMSHAELVAHLATKGVIVKTSTKDD